ncbi:MAG: shikimate dehydrogenase [Gammaproteobacteria bacterium]
MSGDFHLKAGVDNYAVMGNPVAHSLSPRIHHAFAEQTGEKLFYQSILVSLESFDTALECFRDEGGKGLNITVPFKQQAWQAVDIRTARAERAGAVNTVWFNSDGRKHGDTTDGIGLIRDLQRNDVDIDGKRILVLGAGGAVRGVLGELLEQRPAGLMIVNRTPARAEELVRCFPSDIELDAIGFDALATTGAFDVIINAIPAGLTAELPDIPAGLLASGGCCYDMVYGSTDTPFVAWARDRGARIALDGLGMLVEQAAESFYIWRGVRPETKPVITMLREG